MKIVILERGTVGMDVSVDELAKLGETQIHDNSSPEEIPERVAEAEIVIANKSPLNEKTLGKADKVRLICEFATGYDNIDLEYCRARGISVCNVSNYSTASVMQHTFALALSLSEHLTDYECFVRDGSYTKQGRFTHYEPVFSELEGKTWGILGMGNIGRRVARAADAFGCRVIWAGTSGTRRDESYPQVDLPELLNSSDFLSLHCPLNEKTHHIIDASALRAMKQGAILINVARGAVVDSAALAAAIREGQIAGAALDVMEGEPLPESSPLYEMRDDKRLLITPHMAWASLEARERVVSETCENIRAFLRGEERNCVLRG
ncbi:MAG: D-2-hydroxyacid dehydrogenase [Lachnospiraceae bacterium]|nr:D-2-hydroxyacid dehydrogenase [Lachnospiraceae bacterium]